MEFLVWVLHIVVAVVLVGLVLIQHGKGADMGAAFGSGASGSLFGASGSSNFLSRATAVFATLFFLTSMGLTYFSSQGQEAVPASVAVPVQAPAPVPEMPRGTDDSKAGAIPK